MNAYLVLGNGISIDFINHIKKSDDINLSNLFRHGEKVRWPVGNKLGFLSYKHCPALWRLGVRPTNSDADSYKIIEDIITCVNVYASLEVSKRPKIGNGIESMYIKAYNELVSYLRQLFIYYNSLVDDDALSQVEEWEWAKLIKKFYEDTSIDKVYLITYNYDVWLERALKKLQFKYSVFLGSQTDEKIVVYKPHGSISFISKKSIDDIDAFELKNSFDHPDAEIGDFTEEYDDLTRNLPVVPIIPPAGQSSRYDKSWAASIRKKVKCICKTSTKDDVLLFGGLSYWHVDREEIDEIIVNLNSNMDVFCINPDPREAFFAVLTTVFKNVIHFPYSNGVIGEIR